MSKGEAAIYDEVTPLVLEATELLTVLPVDPPDLIRKALERLIDIFEGGGYVADVEIIAAGGTQNALARLHLTEELSEGVSALRAAYRDVGIRV